MEPLAQDTLLSVEKYWIAGLRERGALWRLRRMVDMTRFCWQAAADAYQRARPDATPMARQAWLLQERYGSDIARKIFEQYQSSMGVSEASMNINHELWDALLPVVEALETLEVLYYVGGSVASSVAGVVRATLDVDLVAALHVEHVEPFAAALAQHYYVDVEMIQHAVRHHGSFKVIHLASMFKIDVFVPEDTPFARANMHRRIALELPEVGRTLYFCSPEDIVLYKLLGYRAGSGVSDRQWYDLQGVLRLQAQDLDLAYLQHWAAELGVVGLLDRALAEAGLSGT
jgi:hypothetical protein